MKKFTRFLSMLLAICTLAGVLIIPANAASYTAFNILSSSKPAKTYTITTGTTIPYTTSSLTTRGTKTYGASKTAYIAGSDELYVYQVGTTSGKAWAYVSYPLSGGKRAYAYVPLSAITSSNGTHAKTVSSGKFYIATRAGGKTNSSYYVAKNDTVYLMATSGNNYQVLYPCAGGYRLGWTTKNTYNTYCATKITLSATSFTLTSVGATKRITATVTNGSGSTTWTSSNTSVATVSSNGTVTAKKAGTATITAKNNGSTASCKVTVSSPAVAAGTAAANTAANTNVLVSETEISSAASRYGIGKNTNAYKALQSINTKYYSRLSGSKNSTLIFFFEGVGNNSGTSVRMNAMCVVVKAGKIVYIDRNSSTIPDYPFNPSKNKGTDMPTIKSGIYNFTTVNHSGYAALNVTSASVVRHRSQNSYYSGSSSAINIHRRSSDSIAPASASWVNSAGCLIVARTPNKTSTSSDYARFIQAVGIVGASGTASTAKQTNVSGKVIVDRTYAVNYLSNIGYSSGAIATLG